MLKIKPCPFCGGKAEFETGDMDTYSDVCDLFIQCCKCKSKSDRETILLNNKFLLSDTIKSKQRIIKNWNKRSK